MAIAAPVIKAEMDDWVRLGGKNSGIVGDGNHGSGYHRSANEVSASDYSRRRDPNGSDGPYTNWDYACAGDFWHGGNTGLREKHRQVLARLMAGELPMICEMITKPWADRPVYYWARWNGITTLQQYTGTGHDVWSHISWWRSRTNERAHLWTSTGVSSLFCTYGENGPHVTYLQYRLENLGYDVGTIDGGYGDKTSAALLKACKAQFSKYGGNGKSYSAVEMIYLDALWTKRFAPQPVAGPAGKNGEDGKDGENGRDGILILPERITLEATVKPAA